METNLDLVKDKIRKLKTLASNGAASVGEVANALALAEKLCQEYNLILSEIDENEQIKEIKNSIIEKKIEVRHHRINAAISMNTSICKFYECETFYDYNSEHQTIIGIESDIELAIYALEIAHNAMDASWKKYMKSEDYEDYIDSGFKRNQIRRDFNKGFALEVIELVKAMIRDKDALKNASIQTSKCTALIVRKAAEISEYKQQNHPDLKSSTPRITFTLFGAVEAGREEGSKVRFNKAVGTNSNSLKLKGELNGRN